MIPETVENTPEGGLLSAPCSALFVNAPPVLEVKNYVTAYGYGVTARFDFADVPVKYHGEMLALIRLGGYHLARPASDPPKPKPKPKPTTKKWWHKFLPNRERTADARDVSKDVEPQSYGEPQIIH